MPMLLLDRIDPQFDAQELADIAADPEEAAEMRMVALRLLDAGATEFYRLRINDVTIELSQLAVLIVRQQLSEGDQLSAIETLTVFTGISSLQSARFIKHIIHPMNESV